MFAVGEVISYFEMCREEDTSLQRGMNYHLRSGESLILMSLRKGAPYADRIGDDGKILIYEGHDVPNHQGGPDPKTVDQQIYRPGGGLTQNGLFHAAAKRHAEPDAAPEQVRVYEKLRAGIWVFTGVFSLLDAWDELSNGRRVFKFRLELDQQASPALADPREPEVEQSRLIPTSVKLEVWKRDEGKCVRCGSAENLHFDHVIPYSRGGSSLVAENIQLLCARHNLAKRDRIL